MEYPTRFEEIGVGLESTVGTKASDARWLNQVENSIEEEIERAVRENTKATLANSAGSRKTQKTYELEVEGILHPNSAGYFLKNIYGSVSDTNVEGDVYSHDFTLDENVSHTTLTLFGKDGDVRQRAYTGGVVESYSINASMDDYVRYSATVRATGEESDSSTPSYTKETDFIAKDITVKVAETEGGLSAAEAVNVTDLSIDFSIETHQNHVMDGENDDVEVKQIFNVSKEIEVSMTRLYKDDTFRDLYDSDNSRYVQIAIVGSQDIGDGNNPSLTFTFHKAQVEDWTKGEDDEMRTEDVTLNCHYNEDDSKQSEATLQNNVETYDVSES